MTRLQIATDLVEECLKDSKVTSYEDTSAEAEKEEMK